MTEKQKRKLLKNIQHKKLKRYEFEKFCSGKIGFDCDCEITSLCTDKLIGMASEPTLKMAFLSQIQMICSKSEI